MTAAELLKEARTYIDLTQRQLAERAGVPQSTVARIESGAIDPRVSTLEKLLRACFRELDMRVQRDYGIDPTLIEASLRRLSPEGRIASNTNYVRFLNEMRRSRRGA